MSNPKEHDYIEKCSRCGKYMTFEQIKLHKCDAQICNIKEIPVLYCYVLTGDDGKKIVIAHGFDGVLYRLVECTNPTFQSSDYGYHEPSNRRRVTRTLFCVVALMLFRL